MSYRSKYEGFGFNPSESGHHFLVTVPASTNDKVLISEHFSQDDTEEKKALNFALGKEDCNLRVILDKNKWEEIADTVKAEFNQRLKKSGIKTGKWQTGKNSLSRLFGKELVLLAGQSRMPIRLSFQLQLRTGRDLCLRKDGGSIL
jgi:hypothetical protein